jgi:uncharacterized protein
MALAVKAIKFGTSHGELSPAPIRAEWILEGDPMARARCVSASIDGGGSTYVWECSAGRFTWHYAIDETVYVIDGSVIITDRSGLSRTLEAGDTAFFGAGSSAEWAVQGYVRKVAFMHSPLPRPLRIAKAAYKALRRLLRGGSRVGQMAPGFPGG